MYPSNTIADFLPIVFVDEQAAHLLICATVQNFLMSEREQDGQLPAQISERF
jgi:hypothetical protein